MQIIYDFFFFGEKFKKNLRIKVSNTASEKISLFLYFIIINPKLGFYSFDKNN